MADSQGYRPPRPLFYISSAGLFLFGIMLLFNSVRQRAEIGRHQIKFEQAFGESESSKLLYSAVRGSKVQDVVVAAIALRAGDQLFKEALELRSAQAVVSEHPDLQNPASRWDATNLQTGGQPPDEPLLVGYYGKVEDVVDRYAAMDIPAGMPIAVGTAIEESPYANPLDSIRLDRITIAMPEEPTLYALLRPGDRVDINFLVQDTIRRLLPDVRIVAKNNIVTRQSGLLDAKEEQAKNRSMNEAASRKRERTLEQARQQGQEVPPEQVAETPDEEPPADEEAVDENGEEQAVDENGQPVKKPPPEEVPRDAFKAGKRFDGRTLTVQVTRQEAFLLAAASRTSGITLEFMLHSRVSPDELTRRMLNAQASPVSNPAAAPR